MKKLMLALLMPLFLASSAFGTDLKGLIWDKDAVSFDTTRNLMVGPFSEVEVGFSGFDPEFWYAPLALEQQISVTIQSSNCNRRNGVLGDNFPLGLSSSNGKLEVKLFDSAGTNTATFSHSIKVPGPSAPFTATRNGIGLNLYLRAADNLTRKTTAPFYAVELSETNYATGRVELTASGSFDSAAQICVCYGQIFSNCNANDKNGAGQVLSGGGHLKMVIPFKVEDIPDAS